MKLHRKIATRSNTHPEFRRILLLSIFCALGILFGCLAVQYVSLRAVSQLTSYLEAYIKLQQSKPTFSTFFFAIAVYFRYVLLLFLFSFSPLGIYAIPLICGIQGFGLSFAITLFVRCTEERLLPVIALFTLRCVFVLPTMLYCGSAAILASGGGKESHGKKFWKRFGICVCILLFGVIVETFIVPRIFAAAYVP